MEFKVGDVVYCEDPELRHWDFYGCPAIIYDIGISYYPGIIPLDLQYVKLRFANFEYRDNEYHGAKLIYCIKAPSLIEELF